MRPKEIVIALGSCALASGLYAAVVERRWLALTQHDVQISDLPTGWNGVRLVHLTDFHLGSFGVPYKTLKRAVAIAIALRPDIFVLTGDFSDDGRPQPIKDLLAPLASAAPTFAVLGNHDYFQGQFGANSVTASLHDVGVTVLRNAAVSLVIQGTEGSVVGFDNAASKDGMNISDVLTQMHGRRPCIALVHEPDVIEEFPSSWAGLTLAGHTHGAQVRLSPFQHVDWITFHQGDKQTNYPRGWFRVNGNLLYVNRGLGVAGYPIRFAARPEIACFTLIQDESSYKHREMPRYDKRNDNFC